MEILSTNITKDQGIKEVFTMMKKKAGAVPDTLRLLANSPGLLEKQVGLISYYGNHQSLSPELLALIRYTGAVHFKNKPCIDFNGALLVRQGMTATQLDQVVDDPMLAPVEHIDRLMLNFVHKAVKGNTPFTDEDLLPLYEAGWKKKDILDAVYLALLMFATGRLMDLFSPS